MKRWQALAALAGLFAVGVVSGGLGAHLYYARALDRPAGPPPMFTGFMGPRLERHLDLTSEQRRQLREILDDSRLESDTLRRDLAPRMRDVMERTERRIEEILTPEQRERFAQLRRHQRRRAERFFGEPRSRRGYRGRLPSEQH